MDMGLFEMYVLVAIIAILILYLRKNSTKFAETQNITRLDVSDDDNRREYIASGVTDQNFPGSKILIIMYSLFCRKCNSANIYAEIGEDKDHVQVYCRDCGYTTLIPLKKLIIKEEILPPGASMVDEKVIRDYIKNINRHHEVDIVDPDEHPTEQGSSEEKSHKQE